jgi:hypothetical protein
VIGARDGNLKISWTNVESPQFLAKQFNKALPVSKEGILDDGNTQSTQRSKNSVDTFSGVEIWILMFLCAPAAR